MYNNVDVFYSCVLMVGRLEQRNKLGGNGRSQSESKLNRSISTYGRQQTRLLTDLPNFNWLPSDDSLPIGNKPNVFTTVKNQHPKKKQRKSPVTCTFDSDSEDDFKPCKRVSQRTKRAKQEKATFIKGNVSPSLKSGRRSYQKKQSSKAKDFDADKENQHSIKHTKSARGVKYPKKSDKRSQINRKGLNVNTNHQLLSGDCISSTSGSRKQDVNLKNEHKKIPTVSEVAVTDACNVIIRSLSHENHQIPVPTVPEFIVTDTSAVIEPSLIINAQSHTDSLSLAMMNHDVKETRSSSHNLSMKNDDLPGANSLDSIHTSVKIPMNNELSSDLISSLSFKMPQIVRNLASHNESGISQCPDGPKTPVHGHSFNSTVIGHAADFEIPNKPEGLISDCPSASAKLGVIQSTPVVKIRKLKINLVTTKSPGISLKDSTLDDVLFKENPVVDEETETAGKEVANASGKGRKPKAIKRNNRRKNIRKPKQFSKRLANKYNRSMKASENNSILQHIMVGNTIKQYHYDFLENSQDAYFVDSFSNSGKGVRLGLNKTRQKSRKDCDLPSRLETAVSVNHLTNSNVVERPSDSIKLSNDEAVPQNEKSYLHTNSYSSKKKCLRKKGRIDYKLMVSGSWYESDYRNQSNSDVVKSKDMTSKNVLAVCTDELFKGNDDNTCESCDDGFKAFRCRLEDGKVNQRRKPKSTKPASDSSLFSPLMFRSRVHFRSNHNTQSPQLHGADSESGTPKHTRTRSPGSHYNTPVRVCSRTHINKSNLNLTSALPESAEYNASPRLRQHSISNPVFHLTSEANLSQKVPKQSFGFAKALSPVANMSMSLDSEFLTEKQKVLIECSQLEPLEFESVLSNMDLHGCSKLGEGVFGEVFGIRWQHMTGRIAMKVIPIEGDLIVNEERQKTCGEILPEIIGSKELSKLSTGLDYATDGFIPLHAVHCVMGKYPESLLNAWDMYDNELGSENDRPDSFGDNQLYVLLLYADGGTDAEHYKFRSASQAHSVIQQVCAALAVAEKTLEFEHRDLHWGNVLVAPTKLKQVNVTFGNKSFKIQTNGVKANIIDFTLSRLSKDGVTMFQDLSCSPGIFDGDADADYQFEIYRLMKQELQNDWSSFCPKSNIFWLHYLVLKFVSEVKYSVVKTSRHNSFMSKCRFLGKNILEYDSCSHALFSCPKLSL